MVSLRAEVPAEDRWDVATLYPTLESWEREFISTESASEGHLWPFLKAYKGTLGGSSQQLKMVLDKFFEVNRELDKLYTYAHLRHDEDLADEQSKTAYLRVLQMVQDFHQEMAWLDPELLEFDEGKVASYLNDPILKEYRFYLEKIFRLRPHTLSADKEELLALAGKAMQTPNKVFSAMSDADFKFGSITDGQGLPQELTHASYGRYQRSRDRTLRNNAFTAMLNRYSEFENSFAELLQGNVQGHIVKSHARHYNSCLEAALFPHNIDPKVYHNLIDTVRANLDALHHYIGLRKKVLALPSLHPYDLYVPLVADIEIKMDYREAEECVIAAVAPLGSEYQNALHRGLVEQRWVDRYENQNKRSGAYSSGCYDSYPYILMNYKGLLRDVFTLAHEAGHSMHSLLSHSHQPYHYGDYSIFVAEVASTFNEQLLGRLLLQRAKTREEKIFLINEKIEELRTTLFRQTMFAEFELFIHSALEERQPLTPQFLRQHYHSLNNAYFGSDVTFDSIAEMEWARIPHFYYNFYVYQYATGISAAIALANRVLEGGIAERNDYLNFLKGGSSAFPVDLLKQAGVDMQTPTPISLAIQQFRTLVAELEQLLGH